MVGGMKKRWCIEYFVSFGMSINILFMIRSLSYPIDQLALLSASKFVAESSIRIAIGCCYIHNITF